MILMMHLMELGLKQPVELEGVAEGVEEAEEGDVQEVPASVQAV